VKGIATGLPHYLIVGIYLGYNNPSYSTEWRQSRAPVVLTRMAVVPSDEPS
jgi:hypothetical protein